MISEDVRERVRWSYHLEKKSLRQIAREEGYCRETIKKAISDASPRSYHLTQPRPALVFEPYQRRVEEQLTQYEQLPCKQQYTAHKLFELL